MKAVWLYPLVVTIGLSGCAPAATQRWSDPATWNGSVPRAGDDVQIPVGKTILLDVSPPRLGDLTIDGGLIVDDRDTRLEARNVAVHGTFDAGSSAARFRHALTILLDATPAEDGVFSISAGGRADLWGASRLAWTHLAHTAQTGDRSITLEPAADWKPSDRIAIAPSGFDALEAEERGIVAVEGSRVSLDAPLRYRHWGTVTDGVDERAEVGLLTHTITVSTAAHATADGVGGQVMVTAGGTLHASDVAFDGLGVRGKLGRYPVHFHLAGDVRGSFVEASSIVHSNNRCLTVHGTHNVVVRDDVAFDTIGHCYFLEDGIETGNTFEGNLGMLTRAADARTAILPSDVVPATYWITNPDNVVRGNVAAGSQGHGFWYSLSPHPTGPSADVSTWPRKTPLGVFADNVSHTNEMNGLFVDILKNPPGVTEAPNYDPPSIAEFTTFTSYKNRRRGAWLRGTRLRLTHSIVADNSIGVTFAGADAVLEDSLLVGETENLTGPPKPFDAAFPVRGFEFYDGQVGVRRTRFVNFISNAHRHASALGSLQYSPFFTDPTNFAQELSFSNAQPVYFEKHVGARDRLGADGYRSTVFRDLDGAVTGTAGVSVVLDTPLFAGGKCLLRADWNARICAASFGSLFVVSVGTSSLKQGAVQVADGNHPSYLTLYGNPQSEKDAMYQTNVPRDGYYRITFARGFPNHLRVGLHHLPIGVGMELAFPQAPPGVVVRDLKRNVMVPTHRTGSTLVLRLIEFDATGQVFDISAK